MGDLSRNFSRGEFACKCGCGRDRVAPQLVESLQELRDLAGCPVIVTSGCRCETHNESVGGTMPDENGDGGSYHLFGMAGDVAFGTGNVEAMAQLAEEIPRFAGGGIGRYPGRGFIHVDIRPWRARWVKE